MAGEITRCAVLYPAVAEAARRAGAGTVGLIDLSGPAGLNLHVDRVGITYSNGQSLGDPSSAVQVSATVRGGRAIPARAMPEVVARIGIGPYRPDRPDRPARPDQPDQRERPDQPELDAARALAEAAPPLLLRGDFLDLVFQSFDRVPADVLPVVITTWALSRLSLERRLGFLHRLGDTGAVRPVAWVSVEGVGVAPAIPTFGDRRASGHSIIGLAMFGASALHAEAVGRCWSRGRWLAWLADS